MMSLSIQSTTDDLWADLITLAPRQKRQAYGKSGEGYKAAGHDNAPAHVVSTFLLLFMAPLPDSFEWTEIPKKKVNHSRLSAL